MIVSLAFSLALTIVLGTGFTTFFASGSQAYFEVPYKESSDWVIALVFLALAVFSAVSSIWLFIVLLVDLVQTAAA